MTINTITWDIWTTFADDGSPCNIGRVHLRSDATEAEVLAAWRANTKRLGYGVDESRTYSTRPYPVTALDDFGN